MQIITTKYALYHKETGQWKEATDTLWYSRTLAVDGWVLMEYDIDGGWLEVAATRKHRTFKAVGGH